MKIAVSFLSQTDIPTTIAKIAASRADYIHVDVADGKYVPTKRLLPAEVSKYLTYTTKPLDVHLMVEKPLKYLPAFSLLNTEYLIFHCEIKEDIDHIIEKIKNTGIKPGLALNPETAVAKVIPYINKIANVLILSVNPGMSGQSFMPEVLSKVAVLNEMRTAQGLDFTITIDGGINNETIAYCQDQGIDICVVGSYICNSNNYDQKIAELR